MKSNTKHNKFTKMGQFVMIAFNERELQIEGETQYQYDSAKVLLLSKRCDVIQAIIRIKYPDLDSELAARMNGGDDQEQHEAWRVTAKAVADEFEVYAAETLV